MGVHQNRCGTLSCKNREQGIDCPDSCTSVDGGCKNQGVRKAQKNDELPLNERNNNMDNYYEFRDATQERGLKARRDINPVRCYFFHFLSSYLIVAVIVFAGRIYCGVQRRSHSKGCIARSSRFSWAIRWLYYGAPGGEYGVDAYIMGNSARLMNHSCEPNCNVVKWTTNDGRPCLKMVAGKERIAAGTELTFDYRYEISANSEGIACRCGKALCGKQIGVVRT